ncbi:MAG: hypothetical protein PHV37_00245 [Candidatus Gastranaerophilales bacterium]|nr:hypothetical protein [Candidatus Gastranaerophilales bacterium]
MVKNKIAFITSIYVDTDFDMLGEKLSFLLINNLVKSGYVVDLFADEVLGNRERVIDNIYKKSEFDSKKRNHAYVLTDEITSESLNFNQCTCHQIVE